jgi:hypothetical protein
LAPKTVATVSGDLASKPAAAVFSGLTSKPVPTVFSSLASKLVATVSLGLVSKLVVSFLVEPQNQGGGGFPDLSLKTGSYSLVICDSKSPRRFLSLDLKINRASVCRLRHKTDGGRSTQDTYRDLGFASRESKSARVFQSDLKTDGGATTGDTRGTIAQVASETN